MNVEPDYEMDPAEADARDNARVCTFALESVRDELFAELLDHGGAVTTGAPIKVVQRARTALAKLRFFLGSADERRESEESWRELGSATEQLCVLLVRLQSARREIGF